MCKRESVCVYMHVCVEGSGGEAETFIYVN